MVVELSHVRRAFGSVVGVADLSLEVSAGTVTVLLGPNGAGKTTALRLITGALAAQSGTVRVFGLDPAGSDGEHVRGRCGVVAPNLASTTASRVATSVTQPSCSAWPGPQPSRRRLPASASSTPSTRRWAATRRA